MMRELHARGIRCTADGAGFVAGNSHLGVGRGPRACSVQLHAPGMG